MIKAALRGLLKPGLPNGDVSLVREGLVLEAIGAEEYGEMLSVKMQLGLGLSQLVRPDALHQHIKGLSDDMQSIAELLRYNVNAAERKQSNIDERVSAAIYESLRKSGIIRAGE